ncbi:uncharacterized protein BO95DRAFT_221251 [Aspergillus brunneoviolaceus CBS 621.78]|uniref:Uncharacterized protein n=1 Tax=Aspergillus brunneoviolaceus CBS 621.78 TaxID=1450534 RepID=A0ACD1GLD1_9EURO|nr:hypothetical protein BO95DRAFT_221251 [Aspergillus brunneoviolaceus CBS 621.78]RAH50094.1 hypothetical protein BO95DRAFT_221251 [Aspergillus brunneoviolaceus CBS 621.78]
MGWDIRQSPYAPLRSCLVAMVGGWGRRHDKAHTRQPQVMAGGRDGPGLCKCSFALPCSMYIVKGPGWVVGTDLGYIFCFTHGIRLARCYSVPVGQGAYFLPLLFFLGSAGGWDGPGT